MLLYFDASNAWFIISPGAFLTSVGHFMVGAKGKGWWFCT